MSRAHRRLARGAASSGWPLAALLSLIHLPYAVLKPGPITNTLGTSTRNTPLISVSDARDLPDHRRPRLHDRPVNGGPEHPVNVWDVLGGLVDRSSARRARADDASPRARPASRCEEENAAEMVDSQQEATAVALRATGPRCPR